VNFCLTYQEAVERIHARGMSVVGNFIVGFDTDTLAVFGQTLDFIQRTGILYPFFSILTPMPGTGLFDEMKAAGRLDHERAAPREARSPRSSSSARSSPPRSRAAIGSSAASSHRG
jgi:radical SAM superfamily enzyme YgiQ (UPF0313 family)